MKIKKALKAQGGFTLIEMLIVVAIIAILVAVSVPLVNANLEKARNATDLANIQAAKSAVVLEYTNTSTTVLKFTDNTAIEVCYNAATGAIVAGNQNATIDGYGKSAKALPGTAATGTLITDVVPQGKVIKLTVDPDGKITSITWVAGKS